MGVNMTVKEKNKSKEVVKKNDFERVPTGIPGLDELIQGGCVKGSTVLVTGTTGTGKTTFCAQYLLEGLKRGEPCIYITLEEKPYNLKENLKSVGFDLEKYEKQGLLKIIYQSPSEVSAATSSIARVINSFSPKRLVIDPISILTLHLKDPIAIRNYLIQMIDEIKKIGTTTLMVSEILESDIDEEGRGKLSRDGIVEFVVDGVIVLHYLNIGRESFGNIQIRKMRRTKHAHGWFPYNITESGISVMKEETSALLR